MEDVELIPFEVPCDYGHKIYIPTIKWPGSSEELEIELDRLFSEFGLIYCITARATSEDESEKSWYAYITYYSRRGASAAIQHNGKVILDHKNLKIRKVPCPRPHKKVKLSIGKSQELLTYYFGFNCLTSEIVFMEKETANEEPDTVQYLCMLRVKMPKEGLSSEGLGISKLPYDSKSPQTRGMTYQCAQKFAYHAAMKSALSKYIIIILGNGKVTVEVDTTQHDPLLYDPAWDNPLIKVRDINFDPEEEEECADLDDMSEEQLEELLNQPV
ncbi:hypothetical protein SK128_019310 [Halocaridina rubra]|uniref:RRM domain-containing protein n=1 Tax=Halocaridina rubra TaxID=373956 RepID=A0AAN8ZPM3_HALRR